MSDLLYSLFAALSLAGVAVLLLAAAFSDLSRYRIPNRICFAVAVLFVAFIPGGEVTFGEVAWRVGVALTVLIVGLVLHGRGYIGGGDVKLLAALSLWVAPLAWPLFLLEILVFGGLLALAILLLRKSKSRLPDSVRSRQWMGRLLSENEGIPYGVAISFGGLVYLTQEFGRLNLPV